MKQAVIAILVIAAAVVSAVIVVSTDNNKAPATQRTNPSQNSAQAAKNQPNTINLDANSFEPQSLTVKQGTTVTFKNVDTEGHWPASDSHPTHSIYPEFDPKRPIAPNQSWSFRFDRVGSWGFHDHLFPSFRGTIIVQQ